MWFVARDIAFEHPATDDLTARMLGRMGIDPTPKTAAQVEQAQRAAMSNRVLPDDIEYTLETVVDRMIGLLLIEVSAFHGFRWAEAVLADRDLVAGDGEAARLISYIRSDESPHVAWLRTALSEMRDRTWLGADGRSDPGTEMIDLLWKRAMSDSSCSVAGRTSTSSWSRSTMPWPIDPIADDIVDEMLSLGSVIRLDDGTFADPPTPPTDVGGRFGTEGLTSERCRRRHDPPGLHTGDERACRIIAALSRIDGEGG